MTDLESKKEESHNIKNFQSALSFLEGLEVKYRVRSLKFIWAPCAQLYSLAVTPNPPPPAFGLIYEGAIGQLI